MITFLLTAPLFAPPKDIVNALMESFKKMHATKFVECDGDHNNWALCLRMNSK